MTKLATLTLTGLVIALISFTELGWAAAPGQKVLYAFQGGSDGAYSVSGLIFDASGNLYGTTAGGGMAGAGTVFELMPVSSGWSEVQLYSFQGGIDGNYANSTLVMDGAGNLYGTTRQGGTGSCTSGCGTVFELTPPTNGGSWTESILYSFQDGADRASPNSGVILDKFGNLYGTTAGGGDSTVCQGGCGMAFELSLLSGSWTKTTLYSFQGGTQDGANPLSGLTMDSDGNLYGATAYGGVGGLGTVYQLFLSNGDWSEKILYAFPGHVGGGGLRGRNPSSTLVFNSQGYLVGTAEGGNANGCCGVVFALVPHSGGNWTETVAFRFTKENGGGTSFATPVFDSHGNLYNTGGGGQYDKGVAYRLKPGAHGVTDAYYSFCPNVGCSTGSNPAGGLILDGSGSLYGTTFFGGLGYGVVYEITP